MFGKVVLALVGDICVTALLNERSYQRLASPKHADGKSADLPAVPEVLAGQTEVYNGLNSTVHNLYSHLEALKSKDTSTVSKQKAKYDKVLAGQHKELAMLKERNRRIWNEVDELRAFNTRTRKTCSGLQEANAHLRAGLLSMRANISIAQEFADAAIAANANITNLKDETLAVLAELDEKDARVQRENLFKAHSRTIGGKNSSLLQHTSVRRAPPAEGADQLVQSLMASMQEWRDQQNQSETILKSAFDAAFQKNEDKREELLEDQKEANETRASQMEVKEKLQAAQAHLEGVRDTLTQKIRALRTFAERLGNSGDEDKVVDKDAASAQPQHSTMNKTAARTSLLRVKIPAKQDSTSHVAAKQDQTSHEAQELHENKTLSSGVSSGLSSTTNKKPVSTPKTHRTRATKQEALPAKAVSSKQISKKHAGAAGTKSKHHAKKTRR